MNIFYVDPDPHIAAKSLCDKHVVKMILESAQMLSTAHRLLDGKLTDYEEIIPKFKNINGMKVDTGWITKKKQKYVLGEQLKENAIYKVAHKNHPSSIWVRESQHNYHWLVQHFMSLCSEYTHRYCKIHATQSKLSFYLSYIPKNIPRTLEFTPPPCCMPDECKITNDAVINYRYYYVTEKKDMLKYTNREIPQWIKEGLEI